MRYRPAGVNNRGKREKIPDTEAITKVRKYALFSAANRLEKMGMFVFSSLKYVVDESVYLRGTRTKRMAFS